MSETTTELDLSDLDMLDDPMAHASCTICVPPSAYTPGRPFAALCGRRAINFREGKRTTIPPNACPECVELWDQPCRKCGN